MEFPIAQIAAPADQWPWLVGAVTILLGGFGAVGRWLMTAFSRQLERNAEQFRERDTLYFEQMDKRDEVLNRHASVLEQHTKMVCTLVLEMSHASDVSRQMAQNVIRRIDQQGPATPL